MFKTLLQGVLAVFMLHAASVHAQADDFPSRPMRLIVPFPTGGVLDTLARTMAGELEKEFGQSVVVENRTGASGNIGTEALARSRPDGYTIGMGTIATHGINPALYREQLPYDPVNGFVPLAWLAEQMNVVVVTNNLPVNNIQELIEYGKKNPGRLAYGSAGNGSSQHLSGQLFKVKTGTDLLHVPYRGSVAALTDLVAGDVQVMFVDIPAALPFIRSGKIRPIAVTGSSRSPVFPDLPTVQEQGVPDFTVRAWFGVFAPAGTPKEVADKLTEAILRRMQQPEVKARLEGLGIDPKAEGQEVFAQFIKDEIARWDEIVKISGASL